MIDFIELNEADVCLLSFLFSVLSSSNINGRACFSPCGAHVLVCNFSSFFHSDQPVIFTLSKSHTVQLRGIEKTG